MKRLLYALWGIALVAAALFIWRGIARSMGEAVRLGYVTGRFLEFDEVIHVKEHSANGPWSGYWEYDRTSRVLVQAIAVEPDGTIELIEAWKRDAPVINKYLGNREDILDELGAEFAQQLHTDPCACKRSKVKPTGDPIGEGFPEDLDGAIEAVFRRARLLPGGPIGVGDKGEWTERIGPLTAKFEWKVARRDSRAGRPCLVYEVKPIAVLAVKPETMPYFMGSITWHSGKDEGYVTTRGSLVTTWLADDEHVPVGIDALEKVQVIPQTHVGLYRETTRTLTLSREETAGAPALEDTAAIGKAEELARQEKLPEAIQALRAIRGELWRDWAAARALVLEARLPLVGRPCPPIPEGEWLGETPKTLEALAGKVVVLDFWVVSAPQCVESMKVLKDVQTRYRDRGLFVVGVTHQEPQRKLDVIRKYLGDSLIDYPTLVAKSGFSDPRFQVETMPYCLLVDRRGVVRWTGSSADPGLEAQIQMLLAE